MFHDMNCDDVLTKNFSVMESFKKNRPDFRNTEVAFYGMSGFALRRALFLFRLMNYGRLVKWLSCLLNLAVRARLPVGFLVKPIIFRHFCGGQTLEECRLSIDLLFSRGVSSIPDYSAEGSLDEASYSQVRDEVIKTIKMTKEQMGIMCAVFKPTGLAPIDIWEKLSNGVELRQVDKMLAKRLEKMLDEIFETASVHDVPVMVDAEETWIQPAIDRYIREYSSLHNRGKVLIYNTVQMYRHDRLEFIAREAELAKEGGYRLGYKIVRGAYHEKEIDRAKAMQYPSPVFSRKEETDEAYNGAIRYCFENRSVISFCAATHNEESTQYLAELLDKAGERFNKEITFAQLYGMSDHLTFNLANAGYFAAKYLPYGPVKKVIPYLIRRAEENRAVSGQAGRELFYLRKELSRRRSEV